jgi:RNA polymerase sigma factor for flagellar operon FliA
MRGAMLTSIDRSDQRQSPQRHARSAERQESRLSLCRSAALTSDAAIDRIWRDYKKTGSPALRSYLIIHYMGGHVRRIAQRLCATLPKHVEVDDLVDEAYEGLVDVIERFDLGQNVRFESFSQQRISGAMRDYLRKLNWRPRLEQTRSKLMLAATEEFHKKHGREPDAEELRQLIGQAALRKFRRKHGRPPVAEESHKVQELSEKAFRKILAAGKPASIISFNTNAPGSDSRSGDDGDAMAGFEDRRHRTPLGKAERNDLKRWVTQGFSRRDRLIVLLYYYEQLTMKEIGRTLGCSESRVSQRLESILESLRSRLDRTGAVGEFYGK